MGRGAAKTWFWLPLFLLACAHAHPDRSAEEAAAIARFTAPEAKTELAQIEAQEGELDERLRNAEARRDNYRVQAATDANKENAVEGAEAELASLRARRAALEHRRHLLEARLRDLAPANP